MRQFVQLTRIAEDFEQTGVGVVGMTYDEADVIQAFHEEHALNFPLLRDVDARHVNAWGIRNEEYGEGSFAYGIPDPGVVLLSPEGRILAKWAEAGYRQRADWSTVLDEVRRRVGGESAPLARGAGRGAR
jgi:peroxiredoxin